MISRVSELDASMEDVQHPAETEQEVLEQSAQRRQRRQRARGAAAGAAAAACCRRARRPSEREATRQEKVLRVWVARHAVHLAFQAGGKELFVMCCDQPLWW